MTDEQWAILLKAFEGIDKRFTGLEAKLSNVESVVISGARQDRTGENSESNAAKCDGLKETE